MKLRRWFAVLTPIFVGVLTCVLLLQFTARTSRAAPVLPLPPTASWGALEECGAVTFVEGMTATYTIGRQSCFYGTESQTDTLSLTRVTDMREGAQYENKESYEMRTLDVYRAYDGDGPLVDRPVIFFVHGGGWTDGYRAWFDFVARSFTGEMGWITVVIDYRLTSDEIFLADEYCPDRATCATHELSRTKAAWYPDNLDDVAAAFQWTVDNISGHGGDPDEIFVFGHSAGAHLASLLATHSDYEHTLRPKMQGVISMSGAYRLNELYQPAWSTSVNQTFTGGFSDTVALDEASPATYVVSDTNLPPFFLLYAETDLPSLTTQNIAFVNLLQSYDFPVTYERLEGYGHVSELTSTTFITATPTVLIVDFVIDLLPQPLYLPVISRNLTP